MRNYNRSKVLLCSLVIGGSLFFSNQTNAESLDGDAPDTNQENVDFSTSKALSTQGELEVKPIVPKDSGVNDVLKPSTENVVDGVIKEELGYEMAPFGQYEGKLFSEVSPLNVLGPRDRRVRNTNTTIHPYNTIAYLTMRYADGSFNRGTGFIIDRDTVLTAGHIVYDENKGWVTSITVRPGANGAGNFPYGAFESTKFYAPIGWTRDRDVDYDYGVININGTFPSSIGTFGYGVATSSNFSGKFARMTGYPADPYYDYDKPLYTQWYHSGTIDFPLIFPRRVLYDADASGGQSGSPIYIPSENIARAIHSGWQGSVNRGTRITQEVYNNIRDWSAR
ncbi:trypsin-like serine peptidase [Sporosarcina psychrophila]|uniref:Serine protease n=1 Tax=Sporosarcina psychrophila TaxID=1476 RepID=A0ABV2K9Q7_SPOPS